VPAGAALWPRRVAGRPGGLAGQARLPQGEVGGVALAGDVLADAAAGADLLVLEDLARELAVVGEARDVVEDLAVDHVGVAVLDQAGDVVDLLVDEVGRAGVGGVVLDVQGGAVAAERGGELALGDVEAARAAVRSGRAHDAVIDVGVVDHADHVISAIFEVAAEAVPKAVGAGVADVHRRVHGQAAGVDPDDPRARRDKQLLVLCAGVVDVEHGAAVVAQSARAVQPRGPGTIAPGSPLGRPAAVSASSGDR
jgi:hypothetical protein